MRPARISHLVLSCLCVVALAGCATMQATRLLYNHADWVLTRQLDDYFSLSRPQKAFVTARLGAILNAHRHEALPRYEDVLRQVQERIQRGLSGEDLEWAFGQYEALRQDLFARFVPDGSEFLSMVEDSQVRRVQRALETRLEKKTQLLREPVETRTAKRTERILTLAREWLGTLTRQQEQEVSRLARTFPDTLPVFYAHQQERNREFIALLEGRRNENTSGALYRWLVEQDRDDNPAFVLAAAQLKQQIAELVLALDRLATPTQRRHVLARLDELARTVQQLRHA